MLFHIARRMRLVPELGGGQRVCLPALLFDFSYSVFTVRLCAHVFMYSAHKASLDGAGPSA